MAPCHPHKRWRPAINKDRQFPHPLLWGKCRAGEPFHEANLVSRVCFESGEGDMMHDNGPQRAINKPLAQGKPTDTTPPMQIAPLQILLTYPTKHR
ncbi:MAG: hypothetical protein GY820_03445 [Gammaproteobacteria bacterium]|nr:hypothetical protein [Gammaproteobacteria bacterium]